ncbi:MAG: alpha/beta hydrolase, partial [Okeania sp. SIO2D1]|nr:alpha/beta hydrolase [Okeania sp. SIO2D1]
MNIKIKRLILIFLGIFSLVLGASFFWQQENKITIIRNIEYATYQGKNEEKKLLLDLYLPTQKRANLEPLIIYIHGGGWREFDKSLCPGEDVAKKGFPIACINYRLSGEAIFPAQIEDVKEAVRWLRVNGAEYNFNSEKIGAWGHSAGGHLSTLLGVSGGVKALA